MANLRVGRTPAGGKAGRSLKSGQVPVAGTALCPMGQPHGFVHRSELNPVLVRRGGSDDGPAAHSELRQVPGSPKGILDKEEGPTRRGHAAPPAFVDALVEGLD
eukprot:15330109-Alexandrium_andersonii.AAC.1